MDIEIKASYFTCNHEKAKNVVRRYAGENYPALEDEDDGHLTLTAEEMESEDISQVLQQIFDNGDTGDFLDRLADCDQNSIKEFYISNIDTDDEDYSPRAILSHFDGNFEGARAFGKHWATDNNMSGELEDFIKGVGVEKIKDALGIKVCVMNEGGPQ